MPPSSSTLTVQERRQQILELIRAQTFATLDDLTTVLGVSESTVRRDLEALEEEGEAQRIHGGVLYTGKTPKLPHFELRQPMNWAEKKAIARKAVELIQPGDSVLLDGGSTTYEVARLLVGLPVHVVTNSLPVANLFASSPISDLVFLGGSICPRSGVSQGPLANAMIGSLRVRKAILSVAAINEQGFFNNNVLLVETERRMMEVADEVIVVADSSKFGHCSLTHLCPLDAVQVVVSDESLVDAWRARLESVGVRLLVAPVQERQTLPVGEIGMGDANSAVRSG